MTSVSSSPLAPGGIRGDIRPTGRPRTVLICQAESSLNREGVARWLASFSDLVGIVLIQDPPSMARTRIRRELKRVGLLRMLDVLAFRLYYRFSSASADARWIEQELRAVAERFGELPDTVEVLRTADPNAPEVVRFLRRLAPDLAVARCKRILHERIFTVPRSGTYVLHPGVCPEYRNAHGAFWALARRDLENVGLTLLRIDRGVDTGPVYGYFSYRFDEVRESHIVIMTRLVLDNFDALRDALLAAWTGRTEPIVTAGRPSAVWGQPWLTSYLRWKRQARMDAARRASAGTFTRVP